MKNRRIVLVSRMCMAVLSLVVLVVCLGGCSLPNSPDTVAQKATLTTAKTQADANATAAAQQMQTLQNQIDALRTQSAAVPPTSTAYQDLMVRNAVLAAQLNQATTAHDTSTAQSQDAQQKLNDLEAKTQANAARLAARLANLENGLNTGSAAAAGAAPLLGPWGAAAMLISALLGVAAKAVHTNVSTVPAAAREIGAAVASSDAMVSAGATQAQVTAHDAVLGSTLGPVALAMWNSTPETKAK